MSAPSIVRALMELVHCANWMRSSIPRFAKIIVPIHNLLEDDYKMYKKRNKFSLLRRPLSTWGMSTELPSHTSFWRSKNKQRSQRWIPTSVSAYSLRDLKRIGLVLLLKYRSSTTAPARNRKNGVTLL